MPDNVLILLLAPLAGLTGDAFIHIVLARVVPGNAHLRTQFLSFGFGMAITTLILVELLWQYPFAPADRMGYLVLHALTYAFLGFCFFNMISANISSLRVRLLKEYLAHDPDPLPDAAIFRRYPAREILEARLARLESGRQIYVSAGRYHVRQGTVTFIGQFFAALRRFLLRA